MNMTVLVNNQSYDDDSYTAIGASWFTFKDVVASSIYINGNSWFGFGSATEHLKVNRRDAKMWYLYREEGTLYNYFNFLKFRWKGYSRYNQTSSAYAIEYDVILWDTGDISLHMVSIPTSYNTGTYQLVASSTYTYTVSTTAPDVTFKKTDSGFEVQNSLIAFEKPYETRFLFRDGTTIYTVANGILSSLGVVEITSDLFLNSGVEELPEFSLLTGLSNPEILYWGSDKAPDITGIRITGTPELPQIVYYNGNETEGNTLRSIEAEDTEDIIYALTFDNRATWWYRLHGTWVQTDDIVVGMTSMVMNRMTKETFAELHALNNSTIFELRAVLPAATSRINTIRYGKIPSAGGAN